MYDYGVVEAIEKLAAALEELGQADPHELARGEAVLELQRCVSSLEAVASRAMAAFESGGEWAADGARTAKAWIKALSGLADATVGRRLRLGRALRELPVAEAAWVSGSIDATHVGALAAARTPASEQALAEDEQMLVGQAGALRHDQFAKVLAYWCQHADPDGTEDAAAAQRARRRLHLSQSIEGMWFADVVLDPLAGAIVSNQLSAIEAELFEADWAEARRLRGEDAGVDDLGRSAAQRRADALVEMAERAGAALPEARRPAPLFSVLVGYETLHGRICELADGTVVSPGSLVPWLDRALVERVVFDAKSRVIDVGVTQRLFTGATRRAVELQHRECYEPLCDVPGHRCEVDHIQPYSAGGPTVVANGRLACGFHNRARHRRRRE